MVDFLSSASCSFCSSDSPSIRGMLMSDTTMSTCGFCSSRLQRLDAVMGEHERHRAVADLPAEFLQDQRLEIGLVIDDEDGRGHAACSSLVSISWRSSAKSIGLVKRPDRAALDRLASRFGVAIGGDHDDGNVRPLARAPSAAFRARSCRAC